MSGAGDAGCRLQASTSSATGQPRLDPVVPTEPYWKTEAPCDGWIINGQPAPAAEARGCVRRANDTAVTWRRGLQYVWAEATQTLRRRPRCRCPTSYPGFTVIGAAAAAAAVESATAAGAPRRAKMGPSPAAGATMAEATDLAGASEDRLKSPSATRRWARPRGASQRLCIRCLRLRTRRRAWQRGWCRRRRGRRCTCTHIKKCTLKVAVQGQGPGCSAFMQRRRLGGWGGNAEQLQQPLIC